MFTTLLTVKHNKMAAINPYLNFLGKSEEAFNFYRSVFGGEFVNVQRFKEVPGNGGAGPNELDKIMHIALPIGRANVLMATDVVGPMTKGFIQGNNQFITISTDTKEEADKLFNGLSAGGKVDLAMEMQFWGAYFGMFTDKFGIKWMVSFDEKYTNNG